jgi:hypothetical protein
MSYRRVRSYRRRDARQYRRLPGQPRPARVRLAALLAVALAVGIATLSAPHIKAVLSASTRADKAGAAATPAPSSTPGTATPAPSSTPGTATPGTAALGAGGKAENAPAACAPDAARSAGTASCPPATQAPAAAANTNCAIIVPAHPLTAAGLATPYQLTGADGATPASSGCTMANAANLGAFAQATILDPATGKLSVYEPLVITKGTRPAAAPVLPQLPKHAVVTIDFGFNGSTLTQVGATPRALAQGHCVNGMKGSPFGQVSFCHGTHFFWAARKAERQGRLTVPPAGVSPKTGQPCPTTRSFTLVDQDQSDNVTTEYLLTPDGRTAQFSKRNTSAMPHATVVGNGSDNALLDGFMDPVLGCKPFTVPDLSQGGAPGTSQALDELSAAKNQAAPVALVPENDPMALVNGALNATKTDHYREMVGQPAIAPANDAADSPANYCKNMINIQSRFLNRNAALLATGPSPVPSVGSNLLTFMANRLIMSYDNLNCQKFGTANPVRVTLNASGVATSASFGAAAPGG